MIELRGHHLLCSLTFTGRGYSRDFEKDFKRVVARLKQGEMIKIIDGPDEICQSVKGCDGSHCFEERIVKRDQLALADLSKELEIELEVGATISPFDIFNDKYRDLFREKKVRSACFDCQWSELCDEIADEGFSKTLLLKSE